MGKKSILATLQFAAVKVSHRLKLSWTERHVDRVHAFAVQINLCLRVASQQTDRQRHRQTETDRRTETDRQTDRQRHRDTDRQTDRDKQTDRQRHRQTHRHTDGQTHRHTDGQCQLQLSLINHNLCKQEM